MVDQQGIQQEGINQVNIEMKQNLVSINFLFKEEFENEFELENEQIISQSEKAVVFKAQSKLSSNLCVVKQLLVDLDFQTEQKLKISKLIIHNNIIKNDEIFYWKEESTSYIYVKMEFCSKSLDQIIDQRGKSNSTKFTDVEVLQIVKQGLNVISYLAEEMNMCHHNIQPKNIYFSEEGIWKFSGYGFQTLIGDILKTEIKIEPNIYSSPELLEISSELQNPKEGLKIQQFEYAIKSDIWSLGLVLLRAASHAQESVIEDLVRQISEENLVRFGKKKVNAFGNRDWFEELAKLMLKIDLNERYGIEETRKYLNNCDFKKK